MTDYSLVFVYSLAETFSAVGAGIAAGVAPGFPLVA